MLSRGPTKSDDQLGWIAIVKGIYAVSMTWWWYKLTQLLIYAFKIVASVMFSSWQGKNPQSTENLLKHDGGVNSDYMTDKASQITKRNYLNFDLYEKWMPHGVIVIK